MREYDDLFDENKRPLGRRLLRGEAFGEGEYDWSVCCWILDGRGRLLLTKRSPEKLYYPGFWENTGGAARAGETGQEAMAREVWEETGIRAEPEEFCHLDSSREGHHLFDYFLLIRDVPLEQVRLQPEETCDKRWATLREVHEMIAGGLLADPIAKRFLRDEMLLRERLAGNFFQEPGNG